MRIFYTATAALVGAVLLTGCGNERKAAHSTRAPESDSASQFEIAADAESGDVYTVDSAASTPELPASDPADATSATPEPITAAAESKEYRFFDSAPSAGRHIVPGQGVNPSVRSLGQTASNFGTESYDHVPENRFFTVQEQPLSTFSIDVDTASYSNIRRMLTHHNLPPAGAVRIEELVNYFPYDYQPPTSESEPFAIHVEMAKCPWNQEHELARIALKGQEIEFHDRPPVNLVFLIDVSGSMRPENKLPLVQRSLRMLVDTLDENDSVAIVVYAGTEGVALPSTTADNRYTILEAIDRLQSGGSTHGSAGLSLAYEQATQHFIEGGVNRVILCTDGDFNVGITNESDLVKMIEDKAKSGVFLSVMGFGMGNLKDSTMEKLANNGNGNYAYIDTLNEARKVFIEQLAGTLITIAKDVKIQIDFNPSRVAGYRLIGYENRVLAAHDFKDDKKDAGEIGAGHAVTALYELVPPGVPQQSADVDPSIYQEAAKPKSDADPNEIFTVRLRYKQPDEDKSVPLHVAVEHHDQQFEDASADFRFAAAVAQFGLLLQESAYAPNATWPTTYHMAHESLGGDAHGYRQEFLTLVETAANLKGETIPKFETARRDW